MALSLSSIERLPRFKFGRQPKAVIISHQVLAQASKLEPEFLAQSTKIVVYMIYLQYD